MGHQHPRLGCRAWIFLCADGAYSKGKRLTSRNIPVQIPQISLVWGLAALVPFGQGDRQSLRHLGQDVEPCAGFALQGRIRQRAGTSPTGGAHGAHSHSRSRPRGSERGVNAAGSAQGGRSSVLRLCEVVACRPLCKGNRVGLLLARGVPPSALAVRALARLGRLAALLGRLARAAPRLPCDPLVPAALAPEPRHLDRDLRHAPTVALGIYVRKNTSTIIPS